MNDLTQRGIDALKTGDRAGARRLLIEAIQQDKHDIQAWLWLSGAVDSSAEREQCLNMVLKIEPGNPAALRGLEKITRPQPQPAPDQVKMEEPPQEAQPVTAQVETGAAQSSQVLENTGQPEHSTLLVEQPAPDTAAPVEWPGDRISRQESAEPGILIFKTRPSVVYSLIFFWVFFAGSILLINLIPGGENYFNFIVAGIVGLVLELIVLVVAIRNLRTRYELTSTELSLPFYGKKIMVSNSDIYCADVRQSFLQKLLGNGDILLDGAVDQQLVRLRMRDVPGCTRRAEQINSVINLV